MTTLTKTDALLARAEKLPGKAVRLDTTGVGALDFTSATEALDRQLERTNSAARTAVSEAMRAGAMLIELRGVIQAQRGNNQHTPAPLQFEAFLEEVGARHGISRATLYRWIGAAENGCKMLGESIDISSCGVSVSGLLTIPEAELPEGAREARQMLFDWMEDKTIGECLRGCVVDGDDASRITRAHNGKTKGGSRGEDRKDFPKFIGEHVSDVTTLLGGREKDREKRWKGMTPGQREKIQDAFGTAFQNWPTPLLEELGKRIKEEIKQR